MSQIYEVTMLFWNYNSVVVVALIFTFVAVWYDDGNGKQTMFHTLEILVIEALISEEITLLFMCQMHNENM